MGIGGAETHILEMCKELKKRGDTVTVVSAGGEFAELLKESGTEHITLPLDKKDPASITGSKKALDDLVKNGEFDIVHAHARIPASILAPICRKYDVRFVTTAHFKFSTKPIWKWLSDWGEYTFSVSDDITDYLIENYGLYRERIEYVPNGIDFTKYNYDSALRKGTRSELHAEGRKVVLNISRLDPPASLCSEKILDAADICASNGKNHLFVFVGGGKDFDAFNEKCMQLNQKYGKTVAVCLGEKKDVVPYLCAADVFVGPSRAALEAISVGIPTIVCSSDGYIGELNPSNLDIAERTNLCCGGCIVSCGGLIVNGIETIFSKNKEQLIELLSLQNEFIKRYSVTRMVDIYKKGYEKVAGRSLSGKPDAVVCGYYGYGNLGDEAMLSSLINGIEKYDRNLSLCVISGNRRATEKEHFVQTVGKYDISGIRKKIRESGVLIFGGGNLLQNKTSTRSLLYYSEIIKIAKDCGAKVIVYANGIGPVSESKKESVTNLLKSADYISVREGQSFDYCFENEIPANLTADPVFLGNIPELPADYSNCFVFAPRRIKNEDIPKACEVLKLVKKKFGLNPVIIPMHPSQDMDTCKKIASLIGGTCQNLRHYGFGALLSIVKSSEFVITSRYHAIIASVIAGRIVIANGDEKNASIMKELGIAEYMFDSYEDLPRIINAAITRNGIITARTSLKRDSFRNLADADLRTIIKLIRE